MASLKKSIEEKCRDCTYDPAAAGTWREQTESCRVTRCALWAVRPMTMATIGLQRRSRGAQIVDVDSIVDGLDYEDQVPA